MKIKHLQKKSVLTLLIFYLSISIGFFFNPHAIFAEGISLSLSPAIVEMNADPLQTVKKTLTLENKGIDPLSIHIIFKAFRPLAQSGKIQYISDQTLPQSYKNIFSKIIITDNGITTSNITLSPKQKKNLDIQITTDKNEKEADYYFSIIFIGSNSQPSSGENADIQDVSSDSQDQTSIDTKNEIKYQAQSTLNGGVAANLLLSIGSGSKPQVSIEDFSTQPFIQSGPVDFNLRLKNSGDHLIKPQGYIFIKNMFGQTVARIDLPAQKVLAKNSRSFTNLGSSSCETTDINCQMKDQKIRWPEKFLLGPYTASLNLAVSEHSPVYNQSIFFIALPWQLLISLLFLLILAIIITFRVRYYIKHQK